VLIFPPKSDRLLAIDSVTSSDLGAYSCIISNLVGTITSSTATLSAATNGLPPGITAQPQNQTVLSGKTATFTVKASGQAPLAYQWYMNGSPMPSQTTPALTVANVNANNAGQNNYYVIVTNMNGAIESATVTTILGSAATPPTIYSTAFTNPVTQYQTLDIPLSVSPDAYIFTWYQNGTLYASTPTPELIIPNAGTSLNGKWTLHANNGVATAVSSNITVVVDLLPVITVQPLNKTAIMGSNVSFSVTATGTGPLAYQWYDNNGNAIPWGLTNSLVITNVQPSMQGSYWVSVISSYGEADSIPNNLWVKQPPVITQQPISAVLNPNDTYTLSVSATGQQPLVYLWFHNNIQLSDLTSSSITLSGVQTVDSGNYCVLVTNIDGGVVSSNAVITVTAPPYITTITSAIKVQNGTNCTINAAWGGSGPLFFQWFLNGTGIPGATGTNYTITGITDAQEGTYQLQVSNLVGSAFGTIEIVTVSDPPVITQQPISTTMQIGLPVTLSVAANGRTPITYQWSLGSTIVDSGNAFISGGNTATITFNMATNLAGKYQVVLANADGSTTSSTATVTINTNPVSNAIKAKTTAPLDVPTEPEAIAYNGLFLEETNPAWAHCGAFNISINQTNYEGTLVIEGIGYAIQGCLNNNQAETRIERTNALTLGVVFDVTNNSLSGIIGDGTWTANLDASAQSATATAPNNYNLWFDTNWVGTAEITNNIATVTIGNTIEACEVDENGEWPYYLAATQTIGWLQATGTNVSGVLLKFENDGSTANVQVTGSPINKENQ
jgi:ABC-type transporter Mla MlaB component